MDTICRTPRGALPIAVALFAFGVSGCSIIFPPDNGCPSVEDMCPNLECEAGFVVNADGCAQCECAEPVPPPTVCWDDGDCGSGERCDADTFCEAPPGCSADEPCPDVCYGRCVSEPASCSSDADCASGEQCVFHGSGGNPGFTDAGSAEPAPPQDENGGGDRACEPNPDGTCGEERPEAAPIAPDNGTCLPVGCPAIFEVCPDGTEAVVDFSEDPCGKTECVVVDRCRSLDPNSCAQTPGCRVEEVPTACDCPADQGACGACPSELVCVRDEVNCEQLSDDECQQHAECELVFSGGEAPCFQECDSAGNCSGGCDERPAPSDAGVQDPPEGEAFCVSRPPPPREGECVFDGDCPAGQFCQITDECGSMCDPSSGEPCPDVCVVIGFCQDEAPPPPPSCTGDDECGAGYLCEQTEVCSCGGSSGGGSTDGGSSGAPAPPEDGGPSDMPCQQECHLEGQCVWNPDNVSCWDDSGCGEAQRCDFSGGCSAPPDCPNCLVACQGVCVDVEPAPVSCMSDDECAANETCDVVNYCDSPPGCEPGMECPAVCYGRCVAPEPPPSADKCLEQADCADGFRCASEVDFCYCPEGESCDVCYWQCVADDGTAP